MNNSFGIIAEFSIGLAGFSGIVALIGNVPIKIHRFRVSNLLKTAFIPGFCALLGLVLLHLGQQVEQVIRFTSATLGLAVLLFLVTALRSIRYFDESARLLLNRRILWFNIVTISLNMLAQFFNSFVVTVYAEAILLGGLVHLLLSGAITFSSIIGLILSHRENAA